MKAYRFRLEAVARVRELQEQAAGQRLALASRDRQLARSAWDEARHALDELPAPTGRVPATTVQWAYDQADRLAGQVERRASHLGDAEAAVAGARADWDVARRRCAALERLDQRQHARWRDEVDRLEARELDDLTTARCSLDQGER